MTDTVKCRKESRWQRLPVWKHQMKRRLEKIREFLCEKYHKTDVKIEIVKDPALLGGFILKTGDDE